VLPLLLAALALALAPRAQDQATHELCGAVIELSCDSGSPALMMVLAQAGISAKVLAPDAAAAQRIRAALSLKRGQRVCATGVVSQRQNAVKPATFVVNAATDIVSQSGDADEWPTTDVYTACDSGVRAVTPKTFPRPMYTQDAMKAHIQGAVMVQAIVGVTGQVERVRLVKSLDAVHGLDQSALEAARRWTFTPATKDGAPVRMQVMLELTFTLRK
jgi:TonB family protein